MRAVRREHLQLHRCRTTLDSPRLRLHILLVSCVRSRMMPCPTVVTVPGCTWALCTSRIGVSQPSPSPPGSVQVPSQRQYPGIPSHMFAVACLPSHVTTSNVVEKDLLGALVFVYDNHSTISMSFVSGPSSTRLC